MKKIIVATDFSAAALNALDYAADMALSINAELHLLHVYEIPLTYLEVPVAYNIEELAENAKAQLNKLREDLLKKTNNEVNITVEARQGAFIVELKASCENTRPYMVVMGCQGSTAADHLFFGSRTIEAMKKLQWPLITIPLTSTCALINKIGLACDLEQIMETVPVEVIKILLHDFKAELHIINTGRKGEFVPDIIFQSGILEKAFLKFNPKFHFISSDNIEDGVLDFVEKNNIDLLITLPRHHDMINSLLHKSYSKQFIRKSHVPVIILHHN